MTTGLNTRRYVAALGLGLAAATALAACTAEAPEPTPSSSASPDYVSDYQAPAPTALAPLTGETVAVDALKNPSIAAKIDNHPVARPQHGLERTDIVFEELVEGGLTRYLAVWQSDIPDELGPVRSIRPMDPDIASPFGGIIAYSGGQQRFVDLMRQTPVYNAIHGQPDTAATFFRTPAKPAPHNVIVRAKDVIAQHADLPAPAQQFAFATDLGSSSAARSGGPVSRISLRLGALATPTWSYDAGRSGWVRFQTGGAPDTDAGGGQLAATNVVVLRVGIDGSLGVPKTQLIGSGEAWVATAGKAVHGTWSKGSATDPIRLVDDSGVVIRLAPGNSWIELVPNDGAADFAQ